MVRRNAVLCAHMRRFGTQSAPAGAEKAKKKTVLISCDKKQLAHQPQIILIKTNIWLFGCVFPPLLPGISRCALFHIPCSPSVSLSLPGTRPLTCQGEKVLREKKKSPNHGRDFAVLLVWRVLWTQSRAERRRRGQKLSFAHISTLLFSLRRVR